MAGEMITAAKYLGYNRNQFYIMRRLTPDKFYHIQSLVPDNLIKSFFKYQENMEKVKLELQDIFFLLEDRRLLNLFSKYAKQHNIFSHNNSLNVSFSKVIFTTSVGFATHASYLRYSKLLPLFKEFKKDFPLD